MTTAQIKAMRQVAGQLRAELSQFREVAAFAQFGSDLDVATRMQLERGLRLTEMLKQRQYEPMSVEEQVMVLYAATRDFLDDVPVAKIREWEEAFLRHMETTQPDVGQTIAAQKALNEETEAILRAAITEFGTTISL